MVDRPSVSCCKHDRIDIDVVMFDRISRETLHPCTIVPSGPSETEEVGAGGGIAAVLNRSKELIKDGATVGGSSITDLAAGGVSGIQGLT
jgi:hypothetical protein